MSESIENNKILPCVVPLFHYRNLVGDVQQKTSTIYTKQQNQAGNQQNFGGTGGDALGHEMKDTLKTLRADMSTLLQRPEVGLHQL